MEKNMENEMETDLYRESRLPRRLPPRAWQPPLQSVQRAALPERDGEPLVLLVAGSRLGIWDSGCEVEVVFTPRAFACAGCKQFRV